MGLLVDIFPLYVCIFYNWKTTKESINLNMELPEFNIEDFNKWKEGKVIIKVNKLVNLSTYQISL